LDSGFVRDQLSCLAPAWASGPWLQPPARRRQKARRRRETLLKNAAGGAFCFSVEKKKIVLMAFGGLVLFNLVFGICALVRAHHAPLDPRLSGEQLAIARLKDVHYLFYPPGSHADLQAARPDLVAGADERAFAMAVQAPAEFRSLDHQRQFDALLLSGDPTTYKPLLKHLADSKDFVLTWLDNSDLIFRRIGARPWTEPDLAAAASQFQGENRARFLAGAATRLIAIGQLPIARRALDDAGADGTDLPEYWTALGLYDGEITHWPDAVDALNRALALDPDFIPALTTKAQILFGARRFDEALAISDKVIEEHPDDPSMLFFHATLAHQAHSYDREIAALKHLIDLAEAQGQSTTGYRVYLGQAYAESGDAMLSLIQFQKAVDAPDVSPEQRDFAEDCIGKIREKTEKQ
jgi:tetratricopeptide (TPR) repeat protein